MNLSLRVISCIMFVLSGAASVSYQTLWLRDAMTYFGVVTPVISSVLSVFMLGLAIGTIILGKLSKRLNPSTALVLYALVELLIGILAICVPEFFNLGYKKILNTGSHESAAYLFTSWIVITLTLLPVCTLIGATFPLVMRFIEKSSNDNNNFSFLYFSNLIGAVLGCAMPLVTIELYGFHAALYITALLNFFIFLLAITLLFKKKADLKNNEQLINATTSHSKDDSKYYLISFITGLTALGSEVLWIRLFTPGVSTTIYAFAEILAVYLICNFMGTAHYIRLSKLGQNKVPLPTILTILPISALVPILGSGYTSIRIFGAVLVLSISILCFCFGYLLPYITDKLCNNNPEKAAKSYTFNFAGCIIGPLLTTYILFPAIGLKLSLIAYAAPLLIISFILLEDRKKKQITVFSFIMMTALALAIPTTEDYYKNNGSLKRDHVGYIGAFGKGMNKHLEVNGVGMTSLTTITKNMAHLSMAYEPNSKSALIICMGMGTTLRSLTAWPNLEKITMVELSKGVTESFSYFHEDADKVLADKRVHIVVDDGRRYLRRTADTFDLVILDPPPPLPAAGSGLLYTSEFIALIKNKLNKDGMLAHWIPVDNNIKYMKLVKTAAITAIKQNFKNVVIYKSIEGWAGGVHVFATDGPLNKPSIDEYLSTLPVAAVKDLKEWHPDLTIREIAEKSLVEDNENEFMNNQKDFIMSDDRLYNEFYLLRSKGIINYPVEISGE